MAEVPTSGNQTTQNSKVDLDQLREMFAFLGDEFKNLDDKALEYLFSKNILRDSGDRSLLTKDGDDKTIDPEKLEAFLKMREKQDQERSALQQKLFEKLKQQSQGSGHGLSSASAQKDLKDILSELCQIQVKGYSEKVHRLTEVFLPPIDNPYREYIDAYNKEKMPTLRISMDQRRIEQRKRTVKEEMKTAVDRLRHEARRPKLTQMQKANLRFLLNEKLNHLHIEKILDRRLDNCSHIQKIPQPALNSEIKAKRALGGQSLLGRRLHAHADSYLKMSAIREQQGSDQAQQSAGKQAKDLGATDSITPALPHHPEQKEQESQQKLSKGSGEQQKTIQNAPKDHQEQAPPDRSTIKQGQNSNEPGNQVPQSFGENQQSRSTYDCSAEGDSGGFGMKSIIIDPKSIIMQKVAQNLVEAEKIERMGESKEEIEFQEQMQRDVMELNCNLRFKKQKIVESGFDMENESVLKNIYSEKDRLVLKYSFNKKHQQAMIKRYPPIPAFIMSESEKACFNFVKSIDFESGFYSINGKPSLQKSHFIEIQTQSLLQSGIQNQDQVANKNAFIGLEFQIHKQALPSGIDGFRQTCQQQPNQTNSGGSDPNKQLKDLLKNTLFGSFLSPNATGGGASGQNQIRKEQKEIDGKDLVKGVQEAAGKAASDAFMEISKNADYLNQDEQIIMSQSEHSDTNQRDKGNVKPTDRQRMSSDQDDDDKMDSHSSSDAPLFDEGSAKKQKKKTHFAQNSVLQNNRAEDQSVHLQPSMKTEQNQRAESGVEVQREEKYQLMEEVQKKEVSDELKKYICKPTLSEAAYGLAQSEHAIRESIVKQKYCLLNNLNNGFRIMATRSKFWGELKDSTSQFQIDKDYYQYNYFESLMPNQVIRLQPYFIVESINSVNIQPKGKEKDTGAAFEGAEMMVPFVTKYGSLNLSRAFPNNFKIDDIQEYEFVQRQRAYLYDPLHIKGSSQLKSFSSQVGYGSIALNEGQNSAVNKQSHQSQYICLQKTFDKKLTIQNNCLNIWKPEQLVVANYSKSGQTLVPKSNLETIPAIKQIMDVIQNDEKMAVDDSDAGRDGDSAAETTTGTAKESVVQVEFNNAHLDIRKQKQIRIHKQIVKNLTDDFDQLTKNVRVKKLEELIKRQQDELIEKSENQKKNPTPAYMDKFGLNFQNQKIFQQSGIKSGNDLTLPNQTTGEQVNNNEKMQIHQNGRSDSDDRSGHSSESDSQNSQHPENNNFVNDENNQGKRRLQSKANEFDKETADNNLDEQKNIIADDVSVTSNEDQVFLEDLNEVNQAQKATHAECILDLSFTRFKWNLDLDFNRFHRPNIQSIFDFEREVIQLNKEQEIRRNENMPLGGPNGKHMSINSMGNITLSNSEEVQKKLDQIKKETMRIEIPLTIVDRETIRKRKKKGFINANEYFNDRIKLSLKDGKFCIFEHIDENPIYINNFGMVSHLTRYVYKDDSILAAAAMTGQDHAVIEADKNQIYPTREFLHNKKLKHMGPYGQIVQANQKLPLLGNIDKDDFSGITILSNKLYNAPVFFHKPQNTDFFCSVFTDKEGNKNIYLREIYSMFSVGQIEPVLPVYNPQSRQYHTYIKQHSQAYILRFLQENNNFIDFREIQRQFGYLTDQMLKKFIKEINVVVDKDQNCESSQQISDEYIKQLITPEMVCQFESALYGEAMLRQRGIKSITTAEKISYANNKYWSEQRDPLRQKISKFIENEVLCTPWNLSQNFCTIKPNNSGMLMITGVGDPSNYNGGFSFLKMPLKISNDSPIGCIDIRASLNPAIQNPKSVTGTDADLRKLRKEDIFNKLVNEFNVPKESLQGMSRWSMVGLLRSKSSNPNTTAHNDKNKIFARGIRYTSKTQREVYHRGVDEIFKTQMQYLSGQKTLHDESDYEDPSEALNIPARHRQDQYNMNNNDDEDSLDGFNQTDRISKFIIEVQNQLEIKKISEEQSPQFGQTLALNSGSIRNIKDIPNYKKLLLAINANQAQTLQTGQQIGLMHIGSNSGNQQDTQASQKNAEQILEERIEDGTAVLKCEVLKKIIRDEDDINVIKRIEFSSDPKIIKKFRKRQEKCKKKIHRQPKIRMREYINMRQGESFAGPQQQFAQQNQIPGASIINSQSSLNVTISQQNHNNIGLSQSLQASTLGNQLNQIDMQQSSQMAIDLSQIGVGRTSSNQINQNLLGSLQNQQNANNIALLNQSIDLSNPHEKLMEVGGSNLIQSIAFNEQPAPVDDSIIPLSFDKKQNDQLGPKKGGVQKQPQKGQQVVDLKMVGNNQNIDELLTMQNSQQRIALGSNHGAQIDSFNQSNKQNLSKTDDAQFKKPHDTSQQNKRHTSALSIGGASANNKAGLASKNLKSNRSSKAPQSNDDANSVNFESKSAKKVSVNSKSISQNKQVTQPNIGIGVVGGDEVIQQPCSNTNLLIDFNSVDDHQVHQMAQSARNVKEQENMGGGGGSDDDHEGAPLLDMKSVNLNDAAKFDGAQSVHIGISKLEEHKEPDYFDVPLGRSNNNSLIQRNVAQDVAMSIDNDKARQGFQFIDDPDDDYQDQHQMAVMSSNNDKSPAQFDVQSRVSKQSKQQTSRKSQKKSHQQSDALDKSKSIQKSNAHLKPQLQQKKQEKVKQQSAKQMKSSERQSVQKAGKGSAGPQNQRLGSSSQMTPDERVMQNLMNDQEVTMKANKKLQTSRRAKKSGESILNTVISEMIEDSIKKDTQLIFRYPVDRKTAPGYYTFIQNPICLEQMKHKAKREEYHSIDQFKEDMSLLRQNAERFNGIQSYISILAREIEQSAIEKISSKQYSEQIEAAMININQQDY